jgi:type I restriction enzyme, S subunit
MIIQSYIKPYYKVIGNIPTGWRLVPFGDIFEFLNTVPLTRDSLTAQKTQRGVHCIHYGDIHATFKSEILDLQMEDYLPYVKENIRISDAVPFLIDGDLIIADASEDYTGIGECVELKNVGERKIIAGLHTIVARDKSNHTSNGFRCYILRHPAISRWVKVIAAGISVYGIAEKNIAKIVIPLPTLPEQKQIGRILSTCDRTIGITQQLISQKELQKTALIHKLLTGKKRIPKFCKEKWARKPLSEILFQVSRPTPKPSMSYLALGLRSHGKGTFLRPDSDPKNIDMDVLYVVHENDLIVNITFAWEGAIAISGRQDDGALVSHRFPTFIINEKNAVLNFIRYVILQPRFKYLLGLISPGGAGRNRVMSKSDFLNLEINIPNRAEQSAIAEILRTVDKEILLLKKKLDLLKEQKKGLMQVLLTGKIRVPLNK